MGILIHTTRIPAANASPWIMDTDDFLSMLNYGKSFVIGNEARIRQGAVPPGRVRLRQWIMLQHFLAEQCQGILFWTQHKASVALETIEREHLLAPAELERLAQKVEVVYPTLPPGDGVKPTEGPLTIVYSGCTDQDKGGDIAWDVFLVLKQRYGEAVRLLYVGALPAGVKDRPPGIDVLPVVERQDYLAILEEAHIFLSPTLRESYGLALVEAASRGLDILTTCGEGMRHVGELFVERENALFAPNEWPRQRKIAQLTEYAALLIDDRDLLQEMRQNNLRLVKSGKLSIARRDSRLRHHYARMQAALGRPYRPVTEALQEQYGLSQRDFEDDACWAQLLKRTQGRQVSIRV